MHVVDEDDVLYSGGVHDGLERVRTCVHGRLLLMAIRTMPTRKFSLRPPLSRPKFKWFALPKQQFNRKENRYEKKKRSNNSDGGGGWSIDASLLIQTFCCACGLVARRLMNSCDMEKCEATFYSNIFGNSWHSHDVKCRLYVHTAEHSIEAECCFSAKYNTTWNHSRIAGA